MSKSVLISVFAGGLILILLSSVFIVDERQKGLVSTVRTNQSR